MQKDILQKWFFEQPPGEVWEYLTRPELLEQWLMQSDFQPVVGHKFRFTYLPKKDSSYKGIVDGEVLEVDPFNKLSYSWNGTTKDGSRTFSSKVEWTLLPKDEGTELQLRHNDFILPEDFTAHDTGWGICLKRFDELLKTN
jgi:uncharacterized protein YndB with AHSA1/START domain